MEKALVEYLYGQMEEAIQLEQQLFRAHGMGKGLTLQTEGLRIVNIPEEVKNKLVYPDMIIYTNDVQYFVTKDGDYLYGGMVDSEGTEQTIINDISQTPEFINYRLTVTNDDKETLMNLMEEPSFLEKYMVQTTLGYQKGNENGHY